MLRKIITHPNPILRNKAKPVSKVDDALKKLFADMAETMYAGEGVGLAAPQVAEGIRLIVIDIGEKGPGLIKLANPDIKSREGEIEWEEGCLSVPEFRIKMTRSNKIIVSYMDENGKEKELTCDGLLAVAIQHEIDHLDGKLIIDEASSLKQDLYLRRMKKNKKEEMDF